MAWRLFSKPEPATPLCEITRHFNEAAADEEHFPSTIDPRIYHVKLIREHLGPLAGNAAQAPSG